MLLMSSSLPKKLLALLLGGLLVWLTAKFLLPIAMPFLLGALLALASEPLVFFFHTRLKLRRGIATGIGVTITLVIVILLVMVLAALLIRQLQNLAGVVPDLGDTALQGMESLQQWLLALTENAPGNIRPMVENSLQGFFDDGSALVDRATAWLLKLASGIVTKLPDSALGIGTWLLASYMISAKLPAIRSWIGGKIPPAWHETVIPTWLRLKKSVFGWLKAQLKLIGITFGVLTVGFWALRITHAPIWAGLICLVDALPILGTGTVLIPWSIVCFLQRDTVRAVGLLALYAVVMLQRTVLEPRLVGRQLGLDSLATLAAMYTGYRIWGILGMLLAPLLTVTLVQLFSSPADPGSTEI